MPKGGDHVDDSTKLARERPRSPGDTDLFPRESLNASLSELVCRKAAAAADEPRAVTTEPDYGALAHVIEALAVSGVYGGAGVAGRGASATKLELGQAADDDPGKALDAALTAMRLSPTERAAVLNQAAFDRLRAIVGDELALDWLDWKRSEGAC